MPYKSPFVKIIFFLLISSFCFAQDISTPPLEITEEDASPSTFPYQIKFANGNVTDNGDGTVSIAGGGGSTSFDGTTPNSVLYIK